MRQMLDSLDVGKRSGLKFSQKCDRRSEASLVSSRHVVAGGSVCLRRFDRRGSFIAVVRVDADAARATSRTREPPLNDTIYITLKITYPQDINGGFSG